MWFVDFVVMSSGCVLGVGGYGCVVSVSAPIRTCSMRVESSSSDDSDGMVVDVDPETKVATKRPGFGVFTFWGEE